MKKTHIFKTLSTALVATLYLQAGAAHAAALDISQSPLMLVDSVAPNLIFTLDDSGSMEFAYAPDGLDDNGFKVNGVEICPSNRGNSNGCMNTRRAKSSDFNPIYYNPENTYIIPRKSNGAAYTSSFTNAPRNGFANTGHTNLSNNYRPVWHNDWNASTRYALHPANSGFSNRDRGAPAYYYIYNENLSGCSKQKHDDNCYEKKSPSSVAEKQNFANWYSFYRTRGLATISAAHLAFYELPSSIRFTWQRINQSNSPLSSNFGEYTSDHKSTFFTWLKDNSSFSGATPLLRAMDRAGSFLSTNDAWNNEINDSGSGRYSCRPAYHILMADGVWNGDKPGQPSNYKHDNTSWSTPDGTTYTPKAPFKHSENHTLADLALHYWATDLRSGIDDDVKPFIKYNNTNANTQYWDPRNNPATWQHMVNFTVGLGLSGSLVDSNVLWEDDKGTFESSGYHNLHAGTSWPDVGDNDSSNIGKVYDLWHAAINSRGEFFSADNPEDLIQSFRDILNRIAERTSTATAAGSNTSVSADDPDDPYNLTIVNRTFFPEYNSEDWSGDLKRYDIKRLPDGTYSRELQWAARTALTSASGRNIKIAGTDASGMREFTYSNLNNDIKQIFNRNPDAAGSVEDNKGSSRVDYLKGSRSGEGSTAGSFRVRSTVLGDIVNSSPAVVGAPSYVPYLADEIDGESGDYLAYQTTYRDRTELVYVGANDGMLHAFNADTGNEVFAFVPTAALKDMPKLTGQTYKGGAHRFFVDGSPVVRDVYFDGNWHTVLVGTLGAGGRSLFALDITSPGDDGNGIKLLWEITPETEGFENLGYTFPEPEIVRLHSGQWALLQGNGYNSENDVASLLVIDITDGSLIKELVVDNDEGSVNGLSSIRGADNNGDGVVDYAYAGDLKGNLWRFDLIKNVDSNSTAQDPFSTAVQTDVSVQDFTVSYGGSPLYKTSYPIAGTAARTQAITAPPSLVRHPTMRGYIVMVGTGKYFEGADAAPDTTKANSIYGIWDRLTKAEPTATAQSGATGRASLQSQMINEEKVATFSRDDGGSSSRTVRHISQTPVIWYKTGTTPEQEQNSASVNKWGWYLDLQVNTTKRGEMMTDRMLVRGDTLLFGTLTPNSNPCADGNEYWAYGINAQTGARTQHPTFDFNIDGSFDWRDTDGGDAPSGYGSQSPIALTRDGSLVDTGGAVLFSASPDLHGRQSWQAMPLEVEE